METIKQFLTKSLIFIGFIAIWMLILTNLLVYGMGGSFQTELASVRSSPVAIVFGAKVYEDGRMSTMLTDRVATGVELYHEGKVKKLLLTGDHGQIGYDEVNAMKNYALAEGVAEEDVFTDYAGFSTYESLYRARDVFKVKRAVLVTQEFHLRRTLYIAKALGLKAQGLTADRVDYGSSGTKSAAREYLANGKAFWQVTTGARPAFSGEPIPISGDGRLSWD
jgi:SanA protein